MATGPSSVHQRQVLSACGVNLLKSRGSCGPGAPFSLMGVDEELLHILRVVEVKLH